MLRGPCTHRRARVAVGRRRGDVGVQDGPRPASEGCSSQQGRRDGQSKGRRDALGDGELVQGAVVLLGELLELVVRALELVLRDGQLVSARSRRRKGRERRRERRRRTPLLISSVWLSSLPCCSAAAAACCFSLAAVSTSSLSRAAKLASALDALSRRAATSAWRWSMSSSEAVWSESRRS